MATKEIALPELGEGVTEGELVKLTVKVGDRVQADQTIAEMMTDKATVEVPSPLAGVVKELRAKDGDVVTVGQVLIVIDDAATAMSSPSPPPTPTQNAKPSAGALATSGGGLKDVALPELGEGVTEGELIKFLVKVGDSIQADQTIAEMMTDKATVEVPSPFSGTVKALRAKEGEVVTVGQVLIQLESSASASGAAPRDSVAPRASVNAQAPGNTANSNTRAAHMAMAPTATPPARSTVARESGGLAIYPPPADAKVLATPATRRLAREMGLDINTLSGSGVAGRVTRDDVLQNGAGAVSAGVPSYPQVARAPLSPTSQTQAGALEERVAIRGIRKKIAESMQLAKQIIPHVTLMDEANITSLVKLREDVKVFGEKAGVKITYLPFVMKALIATLREYPAFNASIDDKAQEIVYKKYFNVGFAADTPNGLVVPVIKHADQKSILQLSKEINELAKKARDGKLALDDMRGATITITNIGSIGSISATPIINHPEVAIVGMYKIQDKPLISQGADGALKLDLAKVMNFTVTGDHRLLDGAMIANFLKAMIGRLENPGVLMLDMM